MWYYFKFDEKIIRSLNNLSRNFEFHQPECLKCVFWSCALFCGGILRFWAKYKNLVDLKSSLFIKFLQANTFNGWFFLNSANIWDFQSKKSHYFLWIVAYFASHLNSSPNSRFVYVFGVIVTRHFKNLEKNTKSSQKAPVFGDI